VLFEMPFCVNEEHLQKAVEDGLVRHSVIAMSET